MNHRVQTYLQYLIIFLITSCSSGTYINTKSRRMSEKPSNIIFAQIAGLGVTHLGALRFGVTNDQDVDILKSFTCSGVSFPQSFFSIRPSLMQSMNAQLTGSKSMNGSCSDYDLIPFWERVQAKQKKVVVLEVGANRKTSLENKVDCSGNSFISEAVLLKMSSRPGSDANTFNSKKKGMKKIGIYYDENCGIKSCRSTIEENIRHVLENYFLKNQNTVFVLRDFTYKRLIEERKFKKAFRYLATLMKSLSSIGGMSNKPQNLLTLVAGANSREMEFPNSPKAWNNLLNKNKGRLFTYSGMQNLVLSAGSSSENFCGTFFESEIVGKMFFHVDRKQSFQDIFDGLFQW